LSKSRNGEIKLKSYDEIMRIYETGKIISSIFSKISHQNLEGQSTLEIDKYIENLLLKKRARSAFQTVVGYDYVSCISVNSEVVHGIPSKKKILNDGDIVKIDLGASYKGYFADSCISLPVGRVSDSALNLIQVLKETMAFVLSKVTTGDSLNKIGLYIEEMATKNKFSVVGEFTGHGTGFKLHEAPQVFHYYIKEINSFSIPEGLVIAIEPVFNIGSGDVFLMEDGWTYATKDGQLSAQIEHTIAYTKRGPLVLT